MEFIVASSGSCMCDHNQNPYMKRFMQARQETNYKIAGMACQIPTNEVVKDDVVNPWQG